MNRESKKYRVTLTNDERDILRKLIERRSEKTPPFKRAYILLAADEHGEKCWTDTHICDTYHVGVRTVERLRQRFVEEGVEISVWGKKREEFKDKTLDGKVEGHLVALRRNSPRPAMRSGPYGSWRIAWSAWNMPSI